MTFGGQSGYRTLLRDREILFALVVSQVARLPVGMAGLGILLRISGSTGSFAGAGLATASYVAGVAVSGPLLGRAADRLGYRRLLVVSGALYASGFIALSLVPVRTKVLVMGLCAFSGLSLPPVSSVLRALWPRMAKGDTLEALYALDATLQETAGIMGPALVALLSTLAGPSSALIAAGVMGFVGSVAVVSRPIGFASDPVSGSQCSIWSGRLVTLIGISALFAAGTGMVQVGLVAFASLHSAAHQSGLLISVWCFGSLMGGLLFGRRATALGARGLGFLLMAVAMGEALLAGSPDMAGLYAVLFVGGAGFSPVLGCLFRVVGNVARGVAATETFGWVLSGNRVGSAAGTAIGGMIVGSAGTSLIFLSAATVTALAGAAATYGRTSLESVALAAALDR